MDLAPTILHLMRLPVLANMDGQVLTDMVSGSRPVERTAPSAPSPDAYGSLSAEEEAEVEDRLRALGYLG